MNVEEYHHYIHTDCSKKCMSSNTSGFFILIRRDSMDAQQSRPGKSKPERARHNDAAAAPGKREGNAIAGVATVVVATADPLDIIGGTGDAARGGRSTDDTDGIADTDAPATGSGSAYVYCLYWTNMSGAGQGGGKGWLRFD